MVKKKNILWVLNGFGNNGITMFVINYLTNLNLEKFNYYLGISGNDIDEKLINKIKKININIVFFPSRKKSTISYFFKLIEFIKKENIDIIHLHGNSTTLTIDLLAAKIGGCSTRIAHCHNSSCDYKKINLILRPIFNMLFTKGIACSNEAAKNMFGKNNGIVILKNGIDTDKFLFDKKLRIKLRKELNLSNDDVVLGHVGFFNKQKNQEFLIEIMKELTRVDKKYKMILIGEGDRFNLIKSQIKENNLENNIIMLGKRNDVNYLMNVFDIFVFPSKFEGLGIAAIEAQCIGLPCIMSNFVPDITKVVDNVEYLELNISLWVNKIINMDLKLQPCSNIIVKNNNWDIKDCACVLEHIYSSIE